MGHVERFSLLSATHRYEIMKNSSSSDHYWRDFGVSELQVPPKMPSVAGIGARIDDFKSVDDR